MSENFCCLSKTFLSLARWRESKPCPGILSLDSKSFSEKSLDAWTGFPGLQRNREKKARKRDQNGLLKILYLAVLTSIISPKNGDFERKTAIKIAGYMSLDFCSLSKRDGGGKI